MNRFIAVCGIGCSGTSAVAGVLHESGCPMHLPFHSRTRPSGVGYYEDACFYCVFQEWNDQRVKGLLQRHEQPPLWGLKHTLLAKSLLSIIPLLHEMDNEVRVVAVHRELTATIAGRMAGKCPPGRTFSQGEAEAWAVQAQLEYMKALPSVSVPIHHVGFADLIANPPEAIDKLLAFVYTGVGGADVDRDAAIKHVRPELKRR